MDVAESLRFAEDAGFAFVELLLDGPFARERGDAAAIAEAVADSPLGFICHLPFALDIGSPFAPVREGSVAELLACLDLAHQLGVEKAVFHPSSRAWDLGWNEEDVGSLVLDSVREITAAARERAIVPCVENVIDGPYSIRDFEDLLSATDAAMTFDTGHARLAGFDPTESAAFFDRHRERVSHIHLSDNRGAGDEHLPVGLGTIDFETTLEPLLDSEWTGTMTHEVGTTRLAYVAAGKQELDELIASH
jgi:sugar phosphate isomerase/epimerase